MSRRFYLIDKGVRVSYDRIIIYINANVSEVNNKFSGHGLLLQRSMLMQPSVPFTHSFSRMLLKLRLQTVREILEDLLECQHCLNVKLSLLVVLNWNECTFL